VNVAALHSHRQFVELFFCNSHYINIIGICRVCQLFERKYVYTW
jgi:hypothetical protein